MNEVLNAKEAHERSIDDYRKAVVDLANAEYQLDIETASRIAAERHSGTPVTIIDKVVRGDEEVAQKRSEVTLRTGMLKAANARMQSTYLDWKHAIEVEDREWRQAGGPYA